MMMLWVEEVCGSGRGCLKRRGGGCIRPRCVEVSSRVEFPRSESC